MKVILCIHNHQPVGNMDHILEEAYVRSYMPFFSVLKDFPSIKVNIHFSGYLFRWLMERKPDYIHLLKQLHDRGQLEILSGGMYEPIIAFLPEEDALAQITMHRDLMEEVFGVRPRGMWLAERVYEPQLPKILAKAGIEYTVVDDNHFKMVGLRDEELYGHYITDFDGEKIYIFPGLQLLRYAIPFKTIDEVDECFRGIESAGGELAVFGDDGEKFGLWPGTFDYVYKKERWLESFFRYLSDNASWLGTVKFGDYISKTPPKGRIYLPCESYKEMGEWCLPAGRSNEYAVLFHDDDSRYSGFLKGGYFRNFLVKYPESNDMHKKMLRLTKRASGKASAKHHIYMAQANDSYWHGVFGGLYLPHLRASVYRHLIEAAKVLDPKKPFVNGYIDDIDFDGLDEAVVVNNALEASFHLSQGGILYGFDYKPASVNVMATLTRRYEGYHEKIKETVSGELAADGTKTIHDLVITKEDGLDRYLHYDWYRRGSLVDHVLDMDTTLEEFYRCEHAEPGDFAKEPYDAAFKKEKKDLSLTMSRDGHFWHDNGGIPLRITKRLVFNDSDAGFIADYSVTGDVPVPFLFGVEFNFSFLGSGGERYMETDNGKFGLSEQRVFEPSRRLKFHDPYQGIEVFLELDQPAALWSFPVEVVSLSESGFERNYQSTMVMPVWEMGPLKGVRNLRIDLRIGQAHRD